MLQRAFFLANGLVDFVAEANSWLEIYLLNEFFNLDMKTMSATRQTERLDATILFASY